MKRFAITAATAAMLFTGAQAAPFDAFTGFVGFGDSWSDKGRFGMLQPPSLGGRLSDGPTWMEILGAEFTARGQGSFNMALAGATAGETNTNDLRYQVLDAITPRDPSDPDDIPFMNLRNLGAQIEAFESAGFDALVGDNPLVSVLIGGNDFLQNVFRNPLEVVADIRSGIEKMAAVGARFDSFMVGNLPSFILSPENLSLSDPEKAFLEGLIGTFNTALTLEMADLALDAGLEIEIFDVYSAFNDIYASAVSDGLIVDDACTDSLTSFDPDNKCLVPGSSLDYLFMDDVHPGTYAHSRLGAAAVAQVADRLAPVPLPATAPLLLAGLALCTILARRRAA